MKHTMSALLGSSTIAGALCVAMLSSSAQPSAASAPAPTAATVAAQQTDAVVELRLNMRTLWEEQSAYLRNLIVSTTGDLRDQETVARRLTKNANQIAVVLQPYFTSAADAQLAFLFKERVRLTQEFIAAASAGSKDASKEFLAWSDNARAIAALLVQLDPKWSIDTLVDALLGQQSLIRSEVTARLNNDWEGDIAMHDSVHLALIEFADLLSDGIIQQLPNSGR